MEQQERKRLTPVQLAVFVLLVAVASWFGWREFQQASERGEMQGAQTACEILNDETCVYDSRFDEWVPRSEAR